MRFLLVSLSYCILSASGGLSSCTNDHRSKEAPAFDSPRIKNKTSIKVPEINQRFTLGQTIPFEVESPVTIDSIRVEIDNYQQTFYEPRFSWQPAVSKTGKQRFKVTTFFEGQSETHIPRVIYNADSKPINMGFEIISKYPHDITSYTQGLFFKDDVLYESTGQKGQSTLSKVALRTGKKIQSIPIDGQYFGEGSTYWKDQIIMLTYVSNIGFVFDDQLRQKDVFHYDHQGWGIATWGDTLIVSDGSETLHLMDPRDFSELGKLEVYDDNGPVISLNELEMIKGVLYANIYTTDFIVGIDPKSGNVLQKINMAGLLNETEKSQLDEVNEVLNGIAYHSGVDKIYLTGKHWPYLFEVKFISTEGLVQ